MSTAPAGWYRNPNSPSEEIFWDGQAYTGHNRPAAPAIVPPPPPSPGNLPTGFASSAGVPDPAPDAVPTAKHPGSKLVVWGIVIAAVAVLCAVIPALSVVAWLFAVPAIVLGLVGLIKYGRPRGKALSAIIAGGAALIVGFSVSAAAAGGKSDLSHVADARIAINASEQPSNTPSPALSSSTPKPTGESKPVVESSPYGAYPSAEKQFIAIAEAAAKAYGSAETDLQESQVIKNRDAKLCATIPGNQMKDWVGKIHDIGANGEGKAWINVEIAPAIVVQTWNNAFSDAVDNTLISTDASFFGALVSMKKDTKIAFSGTLLGDSGSCLEMANLTQTFGASDPNFIATFSKVTAQ